MSKSKSSRKHLTRSTFPSRAASTAASFGVIANWSINSTTFTNATTREGRNASKLSFCVKIGMDS
ncbi:hypothetical protein PC116_g14717 [Phytophthora cactorum]|nr:hypothetical protein PC116_g14717 [Phytophthora cactorum]